MLTEPQISTTLEVLCPDCGRECPGAILPFLYADELGARCPDCGSILIVGHDGDARGKVRKPCYLLLSERLEGSGLHGKLAQAVGEGRELELRVDRAGETRTVLLASSGSSKAFAARMKTR